MIICACITNSVRVRRYDYFALLCLTWVLYTVYHSPYIRRMAMMESQRMRRLDVGFNTRSGSLKFSSWPSLNSARTKSCLVEHDIEMTMSGKICATCNDDHIEESAWRAWMVNDRLLTRTLDLNGTAATCITVNHWYVNFSWLVVKMLQHPPPGQLFVNSNVKHMVSIPALVRVVRRHMGRQLSDPSFWLQSSYSKELATATTVKPELCGITEPVQGHLSTSACPAMHAKLIERVHFHPLRISVTTKRKTTITHHVHK